MFRVKSILYLFYQILYNIIHTLILIVNLVDYLKKEIQYVMLRVINISLFSHNIIDASQIFVKYLGHCSVIKALFLLKFSSIYIMYNLRSFLSLIKLSLGRLSLFLGGS